MPKGRKVDSVPNKVMIPTASLFERGVDGSLTMTVPYNNNEGVRTSQKVTLRVENDEIVMVQPVSA